MGVFAQRVRPKTKAPRIARIVEDPKHAMMRQRRRDYLPCSNARSDSPRPPDSFRSEVPHHLPSRACTTKGVEEQGPRARVEGVTDRRPNPQLAATRLVELAPEQART